jgi:hypothetical protein
VQRSPDCASCPQNVFLLSDQPAVASAILTRTASDAGAL